MKIEASSMEKGILKAALASYLDKLERQREKAAIPAVVKALDDAMKEVKVVAENCA